MPAKLFGQFLLDRGRITREQLFEAVELQKSLDVTPGMAAIDRGYMTANQVERVNRLQEESGKGFGEIAVSEGCITDRQVGGLLLHHNANRLILGEALVQKGLVSLAVLGEELEAFKNDHEGIPLSVREVYRDHPDSKRLEVFAEAVTEAFLRVGGQVVRVAPCHQDIAVGNKHDFTIYQDIAGSRELRFCLHVTVDILEAVAAEMMGEESAKDHEIALSGAAEFVNIINGNVCTKLSSLGETCEMKPPVACDNRRTSSVDFASQVQGAGATITPLLHLTGGIEFWVIDLGSGGERMRDGDV